MNTGGKKVLLAKNTIKILTGGNRVISLTPGWKDHPLDLVWWAQTTDGCMSSIFLLVLSVLRFMSSDYLFGIFKLFSYKPRCLGYRAGTKGLISSGPGWLNELGSWIYLATHTSLSPTRRGFAPAFVNYKKVALDSQLQVIKFTSCLSMVGGSLLVLRLLPPLKLVVMI